MGSVCAEHHHHHHHKYHPLLSPKKSLQDLNIPPRKLLSRRSGLSLSPETSSVADYFSDSPSKLLQAEAALMQKFLPYNGDSGGSGSGSERDDGFDPDSDPYSSDQFRMYEFKVRKCTRSRSHDWTDCPFSHPGEKARRRDPRRFHYSGTVCPEYRRSGSCSRGDECEFAHGVFECWLHPARYRTEACKDGKNCKRKVCFFAHSPRELRVLPAHDDDDREGCGVAASKADRNSHGQHCCRYCCALSPTSTLLSRSHFSPPMSPSLSPPRSPMKTVGLSGFSPVSLYSDRLSACGSMDSVGSNSYKGLSYEDMVIAELLGSLEGMNINAANINAAAVAAGLKSGGPNKGPGGLWVDVGGYDNNAIAAQSSMADDHQFSMSPSTPINPPAFSRNYYNNNANSDSSVGNGFISPNPIVEDNKVNETGLPGPDLGWVNDLLM